MRSLILSEIQGIESSPDLTPIQATGGNESIIYENGVTYRVHDFSVQGSGNLVVTDSGSDGRIEYLFVGWWWWRWAPRWRWR